MPGDFSGRRGDAAKTGEIFNGLVGFPCSSEVFSTRSWATLREQEGQRVASDDHHCFGGIHSTTDINFPCAERTRWNQACAALLDAHRLHEGAAFRPAGSSGDLQQGSSSHWPISRSETAPVCGCEAFPHRTLLFRFDSVELSALTGCVGPY